MRYVKRLGESMASNYDIHGQFARFNGMYFGGELPTVPLSMRPLKTLGGRVSWKTRAGLLVPGTLCLDLSTFWEMSPEQYDAVLLHEMIHLWFVHKGDMLENHGPKFMAKLRELEARSRMKIPVTETAGEPALANIPMKEICVLLIEDYAPGKAPTYSTISCSKALEIADQMKDRWSGRAKFYRPGITVTLYQIKTATWTRMAAKTTVARGEPKKRFHLRDAVAISDLRANGQAIFQITTNELK